MNIRRDRTARNQQIKEEDSYADTLENQEKIFRQTVKQRAENLRRLEKRLQEAGKQIDHFVEKNQDLTERIRQIDTDIELENNTVIEQKII
ncbi:proteasome-associated ATPase [Acrasis kona]|uniref:Proteasome-associated ATPase n=1 Tax=Acrasis kona TaxID=1008807 RepID=A0AAW2ZKZ4_9EUKA